MRRIQGVRVLRDLQRSWRRSRRFFAWLVATPTIAICSSKDCQVVAAALGALLVVIIVLIARAF